MGVTSVKGTVIVPPVIACRKGLAVVIGGAYKLKLPFGHVVFRILFIINYNNSITNCKLLYLGIIMSTTLILSIIIIKNITEIICVSYSVKMVNHDSFCTFCIINQRLVFNIASYFKNEYY